MKELAVDDAAVTARFWDAEIAEHGTSVKRAEWLGHPYVVAHHAQLCGGTPTQWLTRRLDAPVERLLGFGSGRSSFELELLATGAVETADLVDLSGAALELARQHAEQLGVLDRVRFHHGDGAAALSGSYDLVTCVSSLHHAIDMRATVASLAGCLRPNGRLYASEYVGPDRFGYPPEHNDMIKAFYRTLAPELRCPWPELPQPDPLDVAAADPTEAVQSARLLAEVSAAFDTVDVTELGGALPFILWWGLNHDALWDTPAGRDLVGVVLETDYAMLRSGRLPTYFAVLLASSPRSQA